MSNLFDPVTPDPVTATDLDSAGDPGPGSPGLDKAAAEQADPAPSQTPRWGPSAVTIVWGVLLLAAAALVAGYQVLGLSLDPILVGALLVAGCGLLLVVAAAFSARRRHTGPDGTATPGG